MNSRAVSTRRGAIATAACGLLAAAAAATIAAPAASAAPDCSASGVASTVSTTTAAARDYLDTHPDANQVVTAAYHQPRPDAEANLRGYFNAHPQDYYDLRGILAPLGDTQRQCNVTVVPAYLQSAYDEFMAG